MGSLLSKNKVSPKVVPVLDTRVTSSAPAQLERLDGTSPRGSPAPSLRTRAITPPETSTSSPPTAPKDRSAQDTPKALPPRTVSKSQSLQESRPAALSLDQTPAAASPKVAAAAADDVTGPATPGDDAPTATTPQGKRGPKKIDVIGDQSDGKKLAADLPAAITIPDEAQSWTKVFGESVIRNFHSSDWKDREQSLSTIQRSLSNAKFMAGKEPATVYSATTEMLAKTLKDKVAPIFHASLELVSALLASFSNTLPKQILHASFDPLMPIIIHRCGNLNTRIHEASLQTLVAIANFPSFGCSYVGPFALSELPKRNRDASQAAQMYGRLDLVASLLSTYKTNQGLAEADVMRFCKTGLEMPDEKVRQAAIKAIAELYKLQKAAGQDLAVEKYLGVVKPALMQLLQKRFVEADAEMSGQPAAAASEGGRADAPAVSTGIKVYGKSLPPIRGAPNMQLVGQGMPIKPSTPDTPSSAGPSPLGPGGRSKAPLANPAGAKRERTRMGGAPASPSTPPMGAVKARNPLGNLADLEVPKYSQMTGSPLATPSRGGGSRGSARVGTPGTPTTPGALDDAEENLLQYIMGDMK